MLELERRKIERRIEEIDEEISKLEQKYGMSYEEFYNRMEGEITPLLKRFDMDEIMDDLQKLVSLLDEKEKLLRKLGIEADLFAELDEGWERVFP